VSPLGSAAACLLAASAIAACLWLFASLKSELRATKLRLAARLDEIRISMAAFRASLADLDRRLAETEKQTGLLAPPPPVLSGFNLSKRSQAIRMARRGETPGQIAAALRLPLGEVELLLKVHQIVLSLPVSRAPRAP
jgi:hypothetical protein